MQKIRKIFITALTALLLAALLVSAVILSLPSKNSFAMTSSTSNSVYIGKSASATSADELAPEGVIDHSVLLNLYNKLTGTTNATLTSVKTAANTAASTADVKPYKGLSSVELRAKNGGKDIILKFGGLEWTVVYLSNDRNNEPVVTLWLKASSQTSLGTKQYSAWKSASEAATNTSYVSNIYATSNVRSFLNISTPVSSSSSAYKTTSLSTTSPFVIFTATQNQLNAMGNASKKAF